MEPTPTSPPPSTLYPDWKAGTPKQDELNTALMQRVKGPVRTLLEGLLFDPEVDLYLSYANAVSVRRLGYNDHGPIHARITTYNALKILSLLRAKGIPTSLEAEEIGTYAQAQVAVALGCFLHDAGMGVTRQHHEWHSVALVDPIIRRYLEQVYPNDLAVRVVLRAMVHEVIVGHMGHSQIHSVEAGTVLVADGSDMGKGRSRIPSLLGRDPSVGDMHRFSASAVQRVDITPGESKPVRISVTMDNLTGLFQIEEVMMAKIKESPIMPYIELCALVGEDPPRFYLR